VVGRVAAGERLRGAEAVVSATAPALGISGARALALRPNAAASGRFDHQDLVRGDGATEVALRVEIADRFGNPVPTRPEVSAERGTIVAVADRGQGAFEVRYRPPDVDRPVREAVVARSGAARATVEPTIVPRAPVVRLEASAGGAVALGGGPAGGGPAGVLAAERPMDVGLALRHGFETGLRAEVGVLARAGESVGTALAGGSVRREVFTNGVFAASAALGLAFGGTGDLAPAGRAAASLGLRLRGVEPFAELSVLGAFPGGKGALSAGALSAGVRFGLEDRHDRNPDRR
jgi:hypothetical protein